MRITKSALFLSLICFLLSCANTSKVTYFNDLNESVLNQQVEELEPVIVKNDILSISVNSLDPEASALLNTPNISEGGSSSPLGQPTGYLVSKEGFIKFPLLGHVKAAGLTKKALEDHLTQQLAERKILKDPIISIRQTNFHVTVLGEVARPSVIPVQNERINIMEAIGLAGDLTIMAKRDNVLLIREEGGKKLIQRINLNSKEILTSTYYYLRSNDIVYVEPSKAKATSASAGRQLLPVVLGSISVLVLMIDRIFK